MTALLVGLGVWLWCGRQPPARLSAALAGRPPRPAGPVPASGPAGRVLALLAATAGLTLLVGVVPALLVLAAGVGTHRALQRVRAERADAGERERAVEACAALVAELRAGSPASRALAVAGELAVGGLGARLGAAARSVHLGGDPVPLLRDGPRTAVPELARGLAVCWQACATSGAGLAAAVERLGEAVGEQERSRAAVDAELAGPRATAVLLAGLPLAGIALAAVLGARPGHVLLHTPVGMACLVLGVGLDALGLLWTRALARRAAR